MRSLLQPPERQEAGAARPLWVALHGAGGMPSRRSHSSVGWRGRPRCPDGLQPWADGVARSGAPPGRENGPGIPAISC